MSKHLIDLKNITKTYDDTDVLKDINLYIRDGEFLTLLGPSGCGKTTMLRLIAGFTLPDNGQILVDGKDISGVPPYRRQVNTVFQKYALFPHLNVFDNIAFGLKIQKLPKDEIESRVNEMMELVNLAGYGSRYIDQLSGGQQQRVAIARALGKPPPCAAPRRAFGRAGPQAPQGHADRAQAHAAEAGHNLYLRHP